MRGWLSQTLLRIKALAKHKELNRDLDDELAFHLTMRERKNCEQGIETTEARYAAHLAFSWKTS